MSISSEINRIKDEVETQADLISQIRSALQGKVISGEPGSSNIYDPVAYPMERGTIASATGAESSSTTRLRNVGYIPVQPNKAYEINTNIDKVYVIRFTSSGSVTGSSGTWFTTPYIFVTDDDCASIRVTLSKSNNGTITLDAFEYMTIDLLSAGGR